MTALLANIGPRLWGPLLDKELRVASRRRRNYVLRFGYLLVLMAFVAAIWFREFGLSGMPGGSIQGHAASISIRMSEAGKAIIGGICWFQFVVMQLLAVMLLSDSVGGEVRKRTLGVLVSTPLTPFKILLGKLAGSLLQAVVLLSISLPLLALVRVLGGVSWNFVLASYCITLTSVLLVGAITQWLSIHHSEPLTVIFKSLLIYLLIFTVPELAYATDGVAWPAWLLGPAGTMWACYAEMLHPSRSGPLTGGLWPIHCGIMLVITALILRSGAKRLARMAPDTLAPQNRRTHRKQYPPPRPLGSIPPAPVYVPPVIVPETPQGPQGALREVHGSPLVWMELRFFTSDNRRKTTLTVLAVLAVISILYMITAFSGLLQENHYVHLMLYLLVGGLVTMWLSPTCLTTEKQSRALVVLLTTPLGDWHIILSKALGVFRRAMPAWLLMLFHSLLFWAMGLMRLSEMLNLLMMAAWLSVFLIGLGLYFSSRFRSSSAALSANIAVLATMWIALPLVLRGQSGPWRALGDLSQQINPFILSEKVVRSLTMANAAATPLAELSVQNLAAMVMYTSAGLLLLWRAKARLRKDLF